MWRAIHAVHIQMCCKCEHRAARSSDSWPTKRRRRVQRLADRYNDKRKKGLVKGHGSGFGGRGFRFDFHEDDAYDAIKKRHAIEFKQPGDEAPAPQAATAAPAPAAAAADGPAGGIDPEQEAAAANANTGLPEARGVAGGAKFSAVADLPPEFANVSEERRREAQRIALSAATRLVQQTRVTETLPGGIRRVQPAGGAAATAKVDAGESQAAMVAAAQQAASKIAGSMGWKPDAATAARLQTMQTNAARAAAGAPPPGKAGGQEYFETDLVINDFPQAARYHVTHRDTIAQIAERTGAVAYPKYIMHPSDAASAPSFGSSTTALPGPELHALIYQLRKRATAAISAPIHHRSGGRSRQPSIVLIVPCAICRRRNRHQGAILCPRAAHPPGRHQAVPAHRGPHIPCGQARQGPDQGDDRGEDGEEHAARGGRDGALPDCVTRGAAGAGAPVN